MTVLHLTPNGTLKNGTAAVENGKISIQVNELGTFIIGADDEAVRQAGITELHGVAIEQEEEPKKDGMGLVLFAAAAAVSYTHLDVYKRQAERRSVCGRNGKSLQTADVKF